MDDNEKVKAAIHTASVAAAAVSASPIPFSDSFLLAPIQVTMITSIYKIHGERVSEGFIKGAVKSALATSLGKGVVGNIVKFFPGIGTFAGIAINGSTSVIITEAIGHAVDNALTSGDPDVSDQLMNIIIEAISNIPSKTL